MQRERPTRPAKASQERATGIVENSNIVQIHARAEQAQQRAKLVADAWPLRSCQLAPEYRSAI